MKMVAKTLKFLHWILDAGDLTIKANGYESLTELSLKINDPNSCKDNYTILNFEAIPDST